MTQLLRPRRYFLVQHRRAHWSCDDEKSYRCLGQMMLINETTMTTSCYIRPAYLSRIDLLDWSSRATISKREQCRFVCGGLVPCCFDFRATALVLDWQLCATKCNDKRLITVMSGLCDVIRLENAPRSEKIEVKTMRDEATIVLLSR